MKQGFTLVELLAVVVILALIALIATPIILNIIDDAREASKIRSIELYIDAVDNSIMEYNMSHKLITCECDVTSEGNLDCDGISLTVSAKNQKPESGTITIEDRRVSQVEDLKLGDDYFETDENGDIVLKEE